MTTVATDSCVLAWRNLLTIRRTPELVLAAMVQPVMFVLLLGYVFGGSLGGGAYREYIMGGIFAQTVTFNSAFTAIGLADDLRQGIVDRFRALPMSRLSVVLGRTLSDLATNALSLLVCALCGLAVGWRVRGGVGDAVIAFLLVLLFAFAMSWAGVVIALVSRSVEVAQSVGLLWLFPVTFISSSFVSVANLPGPLATVAAWNPVSALADATRRLFGNPTPPTLSRASGWPTDHAALYSLTTSALLVILLASLAVARYRRLSNG